MAAPTVSIAIPTLNRSHLLRTALRSALAQTYEDIEVIVSDDCSDDGTPAVVQEFHDARIRYVRTPSRFNMPDSFEFALEQTRGAYVTFLTDDSYLLPNCIEAALGAARRHQTELVAWRHAGYFDSSWIEPFRRNMLYVPKSSRRASRLESQASLRHWFRDVIRHTKAMPRSINSLCLRRVIDRALTRQPRLFLPPAPDHSSGVAMLMNTDTYTFIDDALVVDGVARESIGPSQSFTMGEQAGQFYKSFGSDLNRVTFLGLPLVPAIVAQSFQNACAYYGASCPPLDRKNLGMHLVDGLGKIEVYARPMDEYFDVLSKARRSLGMSSVEIVVLRLMARIKWSAVRQVRSNVFLHRLETLRGLMIVPGDDFGFVDVEGAARVLHALRPAIAP